jgi:hypothetical protein
MHTQVGVTLLPRTIGCIYRQTGEVITGKAIKDEWETITAQRFI